MSASIVSQDAITISDTRTGKVMQLIRERIERRLLTPGSRLPSVRAMAESTGFSKSTVVEAYDRLAAEGVIRARPGSGFYVAAPLAPLALDRIEARAEREIDPIWMLRQSLIEKPEALKPGSGSLPLDWLASDAMRKALRATARSGGEAGQSNGGTPMGSPTLRALLARRMAEQRVEVSPDQILLTDSGTQALDLVCRFLLQPGDAVLVDDPCFFNFLGLLRAHRAKVVGVPMTPTGPDLAAFAEAVATHRPRLYITNSAIHNPTSVSISATTAHRLLKLAEANDMVIVEDDIFADFEEELSPRLAAFDGLERVIRIGSFSKSATTSIRCGHIAVRPDWVEPLTDLRIATSNTGNPLGAELLLAMLTDGGYRHHMEMIRRRLARARARLLRRLKAAGLVPWIEPKAGIFVWARLPGGRDAAHLARIGLAEDIVLAPGNVFSTSGLWGDYLRFNVAHSEDERIFAFLERECPRG